MERRELKKLDVVQISKLGRVKRLGSASAAQVVSAYRHDFLVAGSGVKWPEDGDEHTLPFLRLRVLQDAGRAPGFILEFVWSLYTLSADELLDNVFPVWGGYTLTTRETAAEVDRGRIPLGDEGQRRLAEFRDMIRAGTLTMGYLVAKRSNGAIHLVEGHHRVVAAQLERRLPPEVDVFIGEPPPLKLRLAVYKFGPEAHRP